MAFYSPCYVFITLDLYVEHPWCDNANRTRQNNHICLKKMHASEILSRPLIYSVQTCVNITCTIIGEGMVKLARAWQRLNGDALLLTYFYSWYKVLYLISDRNQLMYKFVKLSLQTMHWTVCICICVRTCLFFVVFFVFVFSFFFFDITWQIN